MAYGSKQSLELILPSRGRLYGYRVHQESTFGAFRPSVRAHRHDDIYCKLDQHNEEKYGAANIGADLYQASPKICEEIENDDHIYKALHYHHSPQYLNFMITHKLSVKHVAKMINPCQPSQRKHSPLLGECFLWWTLPGKSGTVSLKV